MNICVYGAASKEIDKLFINAGEELGAMLAARGHTLIFGGGAHGMMGALARGADSKNGSIVSVAPSFFDVDGVLYEWCSEYVYTDTMRERKQIMEDRSDGFIVSPGGIGTFEEFFEIFTLRQLDRHRKPIAVYNIDGYYDPMLTMLENAVDRGFMNGGNLGLFFVSDRAEEILDYIENPERAATDIRKLRNI